MQEKANSQHANPFCENHPEESIDSVCTGGHCFKFICHHCYKSHTEYHEKTKTFPVVESLEDTLTKCTEILTSLLEKASQESYKKDQSLLEKLKGKIEYAREKCISEINKHFDAALEKLEEDIVEVEEKETARAMESWNEYVTQIGTKLKSIKIGDLSENMLKNIYKGKEDEIYLAEKKKAFSELEPVTYMINDALYSEIQKALARNCSLLKATGHHMQFPPDKRHPHFEVEGDSIITIRKTTNGSGTCIGSALPKGGIVEWNIKLVKTTSIGGWNCIGVIDHDTVDLNANNFQQASCFCTDQWCYKMTVDNKPPIQQGNVYKVRIDYPANEIRFTGEDGFSGVLKDISDKTFYPFFDFKNTGEVQLYNYSVSLG
mmetsp:Transcript_65974/g.76641  ORF Transcript_65974/g.76641 Transcript_65974/m.76641 type:complete len:375 (+) Transcript_65974:43-1167(+)|eukprot:CAMPEP_0176410762 /NCGR_PEP_ID=MMETSP0127-20121128/3237_1 /TAXON_ID=938130 /ORGANISM="Platyophrya macrostoma, Strain WH" /LENGTH=374 /DNA_ID=CAMNT_0017790295 /DNA_START=42 /DNA_END=1166 /DNA_ORIENTATION=-